SRRRHHAGFLRTTGWAGPSSLACRPRDGFFGAFVVGAGAAPAGLLSVWSWSYYSVLVPAALLPLGGRVFPLQLDVVPARLRLRHPLEGQVGLRLVQVALGDHRLVVVGVLGAGARQLDRHEVPPQRSPLLVARVKTIAAVRLDVRLDAFHGRVPL